MKLKKCRKCGRYTLKPKHCGQKTKLAGYKFFKNLNKHPVKNRECI